ncbi:unnamed protein product [Heligmosomoides polygyrus]|uniref:NR LBD domain-containing protein n=1 Tax=Heligmosomoides polygyrus TaxID=6339 RepID=A0A183GBN7_HELPZ|nr:unnamed protein product [Heligmosomoides polygyrus]
MGNDLLCKLLPWTTNYANNTLTMTGEQALVAIRLCWYYKLSGWQKDLLWCLQQQLRLVLLKYQLPTLLYIQNSCTKVKVFRLRNNYTTWALAPNASC